MSADEDVKIASRDDFEHKRDSDGELLPVTQPVPGKTTKCDACDGDGFTLEYNDEIGENERDPCDVCDGFGERQVHIKVKPITQGDANEYVDEDDIDDLDDLPDEDVCALIRDFVVEPDFSDLESIDDINAFAVTPLLMAIFKASGFEMVEGLMREQGAQTPQIVEEIEGNSRGGN